MTAVEPDRPSPEPREAASPRPGFPGPASAAETSREHLLARLGALEAQVRGAVARRRAHDTRPHDPFRGLYVSDEQASATLDGPAFDVAPTAEDWIRLVGIEAWADEVDATGGTLRLRRVAEGFGLEDPDVALLLVALAPDLDPRFERLYGYLHDDVTRRRASVGLALGLAGLGLDDADARGRLAPGSRLIARGLVVLEDRERPALARSLRVPDRVTAFLLGDDDADAELAAVLDPRVMPDTRGAHVGLARALASGVRLSYLREVAGSAAATAAAGAAQLTGLPWLAVDLGRLARSADPRALAAAAVVEARLRSAVLIAGPIESLAEAEPGAGVLGSLVDAGWPTVLFGARAWEPAWGRAVPLQLDARPLAGDDRARHWRLALEREPGAPQNGHVAELVGATQAFHLTPGQIGRAVESSLLLAIAEDRDLAPKDLQAGARRQNAAGLERLARRVEPTAGWDDLVVPGDVGAQLRELAARARNRDRVLGEWRIGGRSSRGRGITALFAGESGTGKTLSAEVIARELGLDLYVIDLSTVVDKYIGETEKNLDRIFSEADRVNGVLLFDEADAIFGKRSEVRDARDRYANVEVAYLLQRMERFDGLAVLTTNLRANLDDSFTRRLDSVVDFPTPDEPARHALWRMHLPAQLPQADDLDLDFLARRFALPGGNIRNICLTAAYFAAEAESPVRMDDLIRATGREYQKLGRLVLADEFGPWHRLFGGDA